jgi:thioredoxin-dependent peroxiredoxin
MQFNAGLEQVNDLGAQVIGVSGDTPESHQDFATRHSLTILLLSDTDHPVLKSVGPGNLRQCSGKNFLAR